MGDGMKAEFAAVDIHGQRLGDPGVAIAKKKLRQRPSGIFAVPTVHAGTETTVGKILDGSDARARQKVERLEPRAVRRKTRHHMGARIRDEQLAMAAVITETDHEPGQPGTQLTFDPQRRIVMQYSPRTRMVAQIDVAIVDIRSCEKNVTGFEIHEYS